MFCACVLAPSPPEPKHHTAIRWQPCVSPTARGNSDFSPRETPECRLPEPLLGSGPMPALCVEQGGCAQPPAGPRHRGDTAPRPAKPCLPKLGPSSSPHAGEVTPLSLQQTAGLLWLHVCNSLKHHPGRLTQQIIKEWWTKCGFPPEQLEPGCWCDRRFQLIPSFLVQPRGLQQQQQPPQPVQYCKSPGTCFSLGLQGVGVWCIRSVTLTIISSSIANDTYLLPGCACAALRDAAAAWCLFYNSSMNEWCNRAGGTHHRSVRTGKRGLERWEVHVNIHQVHSSPFQLLLKSCLNKFPVGTAVQVLV